MYLWWRITDLFILNYKFLRVPLPHEGYTFVKSASLKPSLKRNLRLGSKFV